MVFGNEGDDWIEGGGQADLLQGGNGDPFQDDTITGDDVIIGDGGNDDYDSEGGDDIMVTGPGIERNEGMLGFDWVTHKGDPQAGERGHGLHRACCRPTRTTSATASTTSRACRAGSTTTSCAATASTAADHGRATSSRRRADRPHRRAAGRCSATA